jgi:hypothetical protein
MSASNPFLRAFRDAKQTYWHGYKAGSRFADTGNYRDCPDSRWLSWQAAEMNGLGGAYQQGVQDGVVQKYGRFDQELAIRIDELPGYEQIDASFSLPSGAACREEAAVNLVS